MSKAFATISKPASAVHFWACFAVVFSLIAQVLFPVQAMSMVTRDGTAFVLCTGDADLTVVTKVKTEHKKGLMGLKCADCVVASITAIQTGAATFLPARQRIEHADFRPAAEVASIKARAPPRPHSCGPPTPTQA